LLRQPGTQTGERRCSYCRNDDQEACDWALGHGSACARCKKRGRMCSLTGNLGNSFYLNDVARFSGLPEAMSDKELIDAYKRHDKGPASPTNKPALYRFPEDSRRTYIILRLEIDATDHSLLVFAALIGHNTPRQRYLLPESKWHPHAIVSTHPPSPQLLPSSTHHQKPSRYMKTRRSI
jgi:hypothetical protein